MPKKIPHLQIILASTSPRRKGLLGLTGLKFKAIAPDYEEDMTLKLPPKKLAAYLSMGKAQAVAKKYKNALVIAGDTFVVLSNKVMGKPKDKKEAEKMLRSLSGRQHSVLTGMALVRYSQKKRYSIVVETKVHFKKLSSREIAGYLSRDEWKGAAGSYAIQGLADMFLEKLEGEYSNIVGLPVGSLIKGLERFGVNVF
jgi:septum formation protein